MSEEVRARADILVEFLEVAFHSILFYREVYPKRIFCLKKKYQIPIHVSEHPDVNSYILECLKTAKELVEHDGLKQIALLIVKEDEVPVEKYCFDLETSTDGVSDPYFIRAEEIFRDYLLKLSIADVVSNPLSDDYDWSFRIQILTKENCSVRLNENITFANFPWIEADKTDDGDKEFRITPIKTMKTSLMKLNMYIES